ncbi:hypothetical protein DRO32_05385 [Candidatus Bathyarchaeota archaeon]|nr:MAG: hypothetical protein DRO32_05385 [Candidatus Bathyarchaeota archaeon]
MPPEGQRLPLETPRKLLEHLVLRFPGREREAKAVVLGLVAGEHVSLIGEPGVAKTALVEEAARALRAKYFYVQMFEGITPDVVFGPPNIKALRERGELVFNTEGYLPDAEIAFLDEGWLAPPAVLHSLHSILNERRFRNGSKVVNCPLHTAIVASNEKPKSRSLQAMWDRVLLRLWVKPLPPDLWETYLDTYWDAHASGVVYQRPQLKLDDFRLLSKAIWRVEWRGVKEAYVRILHELVKKGFWVSDRRKGRALKAVAANALLEGRTICQPEDLFVLVYVLPSDEKQVEECQLLLEEKLDPHAKLLRRLKDLKPQVEALARSMPGDVGGIPEFVEKVKAARATIVDIQSQAMQDDRVQSLAQELLSTLDEALRKAAQMVLGDVGPVVQA